MTGKECERSFMALTGFSPTRKSEGDAASPHGDPVEIKYSGGHGGTVFKQIRALKFIPLVAYSEVYKSWYVIPARHVVRLVLCRRRGLHSANVLECASLSASEISDFRVEEESLLEKTLEAIEDGKRYPETKRLMSMVVAECQALADKQRAEALSHIEDWT